MLQDYFLTHCWTAAQQHVLSAAISVHKIHGSITNLYYLQATNGRFDMVCIDFNRTPLC